MIKNTITLVCLLVLYNLSAQIDTINIANKDLKTELLTAKKTRYLVTIKKGDSILNLSIWERNISFPEVNDKKVIKVDQYWKNNNPKQYREIHSLNNFKTFSPISHLVRTHDGAIEAYVFNDKAVLDDSSINENTLNDFKVKLNQPTLNWELDLEIFQTLPIEKDKTFVINFYHPGGRKEPAFYTYKIIGEDVFQNEVCWKMKIEYSKDSWAIFWISKNTQSVLKMEEAFKNIRREKIKLD